MTLITQPKVAPGVIARPPLLFLGALLAGFALGPVLPPPALNPFGRATGGVLIVAALTLAGWAIATMRRADTPVPTWQPTRRLVTSGPYRITRNPIYLGLLLLHAGLGLASNATGVLATLVPLAALLHWGVILREERYLTRLFPDEYSAYRQQVRRWL